MKCFVIMPFGNPRTDPANARKLELIYSQWIKPTVEGMAVTDSRDQLVFHRADKEAGPGEIITHVIEQLITSDIVIADLSGRNPNVFYELGVRHAVSGNTILITENLDDVPFDLRGLRTITYQYDPEHMVALKQSLESAIKQIIQNPEKADNPVIRFLGGTKMGNFAGRQLESGQEAVKKFAADISSLRKELDENRSQIQEIVKSITSLQTTASPAAATNQGWKYPISEFEGIWSISPHNGVYCVRVVDNELRIPYSYGQDQVITGHIYKCRAIGDRIYGRFAWFDFDTAGVIVIKIISRTRMSGWWWYAHDLPSRMLREAPCLS